MVPASAKPAGAKGVIQFPFLAESEFLGVMQLLGEAHDYRDQTIAKGAYTMRYGLQPVNGDHLGVSPYRDYALLLPGAKDKTVAMLPRKQLETQRRVCRIEPSRMLLHAGRPFLVGSGGSHDDP